MAILMTSELIPFAIQQSISIRGLHYLLSTLAAYCVELRHFCMFFVANVFVAR